MVRVRTKAYHDSGTSEEIVTRREVYLSFYRTELYRPDPNGIEL
jgi:hypothetical protein